MLAPFTAHPDAALASLDRLAAVGADLVLPGHGDAWTDGIASALCHVHERARSQTSD